MFRIRFIALALALLCVLGLSGTVLAAQVDCDSIYCFTSQDFSSDSLTGICITQLPEADTGTVMLGNRVIRSGDILTAQQVSQMTFLPTRTEEDRDAVVTFLPIYEDRVAPCTTMTIAIRGKEDKVPVAEDSTMETYKNLPNTGKLKAADPEEQTLVYTIVRQPKRGTVELTQDGSFTYTPKKNKVGVDSFTYTAADPAGNVSREATVTIQILKPSDARQYTDTVGKDCRFAAEWMRNTGLFVGERVAGEDCFYPEKSISKEEFLTMVVKALDIPVEEVSGYEVPADTPTWLRPYLAAALRSGLTAGLPEAENTFGQNAPINGAEAAVILQNALDLSISRQTLEEDVQTDAEQTEEIPVWAEVSLTAMADNGVELSANDTLTRGEVAQVMYQVNQLAQDAPGMAVIRMQQ